MYLDYYKLKLKPFQITADPKFLWLGEKHKEALATLRYGIMDNRGFLLLTGEVGTGKTILINRITTLLDIDTVVATLPDPDLESMDFYNLLADGLKMKRTFESKGAFLIHLRDFLHQSYANQQQVLLIIDESQRLNSRLMEDIRVLSNIELHDRKLINIFFVGQQEFNSILMTPQNRALAQRITVRYHIEALDQQETGDYIRHRLMVAGRKERIFNRSALAEIFHFSGGIPRLINIISDHALLTGYAQNIKRIDGSIVKECAEELRIPIQKPHADVATLRSSQDNAAVAAEAVKTLADQKPYVVSPAEVIAQEEMAAKTKDPPAAWKLANVIMVLLLMAVVVYAINQFSGGETVRYDETQLAPNKYKTTLEKEKELLSDRLENPDLLAENEESSIEPATQSEPVSEPMTPVAVASKEPQNSPTAEPAAPPETTEEAATVPLVENKVEEKKIEIEPLPLLDEAIIIQFDINSNEIEPSSYEILDRVAAYLVRNPDKVINVRGYTDASGSTGYNESVSRFRASVVKSYLIGKGAHPDNIRVFAMGSANPVASNDSQNGRKLNRRVEIEFSDASADTN